MGRVQVLDDDKGQAAFLRHVYQKGLQRLQAAGGGADAHDRKGAIRPGRLDGWPGGYFFRTCVAIFWLPVCGFGLLFHGLLQSKSIHGDVVHLIQLFPLTLPQPAIIIRT
ncbi:MAG: hypothetical protein V2B13_20325 [Pseudomonadota bacterium]